ncbi:MAG: peptide chain release factor N(5)-glutamine methyltransferase [Alphaproteobacteria bacterium]|jgi:release factor glutamine methyltransferase|nr:peptide chain release factor N(5)-glutamine methyltransferase [Alphaproteobacteria bacterium]MDP6829345.1 peptide chain release factor N(5)-glutamine methyltransferase [Alphaproteobacteria bacterium]MDP6873602.1 peptide chain release factor N(5)-glutamine methyltransferase [Alphaproteobacteria bacterium]
MADGSGIAPGLTLRQALAAAGRDLRTAGIEDTALDSAVLLAHAIGGDRLTLIREAERRLNEAEAKAFSRLIASRAARQPVSRLLGRREFWSLDLRIGPAVLDPRPDSETVVEAALEQMPEKDGAYRIADFGTGSGCLLLALLSERPRAWGLGVDISPAAGHLARENARNLGLERRAGFIAGDWGQGLVGGFDLIVANPPYIPTADIAALEPEVRRHDPGLALDGGEDGLAAYRALLPDVYRLLLSGGRAVLECGQGQTPPLRRLVKGVGLTVESRHSDLAGVARCFVLSTGN